MPAIPAINLFRGETNGGVRRPTRLACNGLRSVIRERRGAGTRLDIDESAAWTMIADQLRSNGFREVTILLEEPAGGAPRIAVIGKTDTGGDREIRVWPR